MIVTPTSLENLPHPLRADCEPATFAVLDAVAAEQRRAAWLADRRTCITGTEISAILGMNPWRRPIDVWAEKMGLAPEFEPNAAMRAGKRFERAILEEYSERNGAPLDFADPYQLIRVPGFPLLGATLDARRADGDRRPVDAKNVRFKDEKWGEDGTADFPEYYGLQLHVQCMATESQSADLAVCFSGQDFYRYTMHHDPEVDALLVDEVSRWWTKHIVQGAAPEPDGSESFTEHLKHRWKRNTDVLIEPTEELAGLVSSLKTGKESVKAAEVLVAETEQRIKLAIGDAAGIRGLCTWKFNKDTRTTDWERAYRELWADYVGLWNKQAQQGCSLGLADLAAQIDSYTTTKPGARVFRLSK